MTKEDVLALTGASDLVSKDGIVVLIYPYKPYLPVDNNVLELDSYYVACNNAYNSVKIARIGTTISDINIKELLVSCGLKMGRSSLVFHPEYGSYFLAQAVKVDIEFDDTYIFTDELLCSKCNKCAVACPGKAINNDGFMRNACLRDMMDKPLSAETLPYLGSQLLGCQICRRVCPHNLSITNEKMPQELAEHLTLESILEFKNSTKQVLNSYIGTNMARVSVLVPLAMSVAFKRNRCDLLPLIKSYIHHPSHKVAASAQTVVEAFEKSY